MGATFIAGFSKKEKNEEKCLFSADSGRPTLEPKSVIRPAIRYNVPFIGLFMRFGLKNHLTTRPCLSI